MFHCYPHIIGLEERKSYSFFVQDFLANFLCECYVIFGCKFAETIMRQISVLFEG